LRRYDVVVVGAGVAGLLASYELSRRGFRVALIELKPEKKIGEKVCGDAIGEHHFMEIGLEPPKIGEDAEGIFRGVRVFSPKEDKHIVAEGRGYALNRYKFGRRLLKISLDAGTELFAEHRFVKPVVEGSWVRGVVVLTPSGSEEFRARLVIDATGVPAAVRHRLPQSWWVSEDVPREDFNTTYREVWEVDMELDTDYADIFLNAEVAPGGYWWFFPKKKNVVNVGLGVQLKEGAPNPMHMFMKYLRKRFEKKIVRVLHGGGGLVPTRRPIPCMVWNGFAVVGDAAATANPVHGGGIGSGMLGAHLAAKAIAGALESGEPSIERLWSYPVEYMQKYGAKQASLDILRMFLQKLSNDDLQFVFDVGAVGGSELLDIGYRGELRMSILTKLSMGLRMLRRPSFLTRVVKLKEYMDRARNLYLDYPRSPNEYEKWRVEERKFFSEYRRWLEEQ